MPDDKRLFKLAVRIYQAIHGNRINGPYRDLVQCITQLQSRWQVLERDLRLVAGALGKDWRSAARSLLSDGRFIREDVAAYLKDLDEAAEQVASPRFSNCTVQTLHDDLADLEEEFEELRWDRGELWVRTEPITLEGVYLGPFEIRLPLAGLGLHGMNQGFSVMATDPRPSAKREDIFHPHVESGALCIGEGTTAIARALEEGRVLDFFQLVKAILTNYNGESAYVRLERWEDGGIECADCGYSVDEDEASFCEACQADYCGECTYCCGQCSYVVCRSCSFYCPSCEMRFCSECTATCPACERMFCKGCVNDKGLCASCREAQAAQEGTTDDNDNVTHPAEGGGEIAGVTVGPADDSGSAAAETRTPTGQRRRRRAATSADEGARQSAAAT